jgi:DNA polymerase III subunit alpha
VARFTHLHVHTEMSLLDGLGRIENYLDSASKAGMDSLAITDHGNMYGALDFYLASKQHGVKPIIGCEMYVAANGIASRDKEYYHLILLAKNEIGYRNLVSLVSHASLEGFYYKPRVDLDLLASLHEGLIATSACLQGEVARHLADGREKQALQAASRLRDIFGDGNFYLELMDHGLPAQQLVNPLLVSLGRRLNIPLVATNDVHYVMADDAYAHEVLLCIQTGCTMDDPKRMRMESGNFYLRTAEEMEELFDEVPDAIENTQVIDQKCHLDLEFGSFHLPHFPVPEGYSTASYLEEICWQGFRGRYPNATPEMENRLRYELEVIQQMDFPSYFLVVQDFVAHARSTGIPVGPGRGSAAGSIVSYCLGITSVDPLSHGLIFERFLNPSRISMPDIDLDFADDRRDEVIRYVTDKYGSDHVAQIITFGTMAARAAVRDVGRALGLPYGDVDHVAKLIPPGPGVTITAALEAVPELQSLSNDRPEIANLINTAQRLEGVSRHASTHAAGVVISRDPLTEQVPLQRFTRDGETVTVTQYHMGDLERIGLLKMDFLGLSTLTVLQRTVDLVKSTRGIEVDLDKVPLEDPAIYDLLRRGDTSGIFQLEGGMTKRMTTDVKPNCFDDVAALMALIRPGPMTMAPLYIERKHGQVPIKYEHPDLEPILRQTYGVALYQEQVMRIANVLAGFTMSEADALRKAMGKKLPEEMKKQRNRFVSGAKKHGVAAKVAEEIFAMIERFAGYGFNKAHSVAYAVIACQTAYFKAKYPVEYATALLTSESADAGKVSLYISEAHKAGIQVLPPSVNRSFHGFTIERLPKLTGEDYAIRFGLAAVKNVGQGMVEAIIDAREHLCGDAFTSFEQFCEEVDPRQINRRALESLIKCGAMDSFGPRQTLLANVERSVSLGQKTRRAREEGQGMLFGLLDDTGANLAFGLPDLPEPTRKQLLAWEKEALGLYVSEHPLQHVMASFSGEILTVADLNQDLAGQKVRLLGLVVGLRSLVTKKKKTMAIAQLEDLTGTVDLVIFPESYERYRGLLVEDTVLTVEARVDFRSEEPQLICESLSECLATPEGDDADQRPPSEFSTATQSRLWLQITSTEDIDEDIRRMEDLERLLRRYPGEGKVVLQVKEGASVTCLETSSGAELCDQLTFELADLLGSNAIAIDSVSAADPPAFKGNGK